MFTRSPRLEPGRGALVITLDLEFAWAYYDLPADQAVRPYDAERPAVADLLALFARYDVPAGWLTVAAATLDPDSPAARTLIDEAFDPVSGWYDPALRRVANTGPRSWWHAPGVLDEIRAVRGQEVGCHTFAHLPWHRVRGNAAAAFARDLAHCARAFAPAGVTPVSFAYPRNGARHEGALAAAGYRVYRRPSPGERVGGARGRALRAAAAWLEWTPETAPVAHRDDGLAVLPGGLMLTHNEGWARRLPLDARVRRIEKGLSRAVARGEVLSLWFHPLNVAGAGRRLLEPLAVVLERAARLREAGRLLMLSPAEAARL